MWHPFLGYSPMALAWFFGLLLLGTGFCTFWLQSFSRRLRTTTAPLGLVSLQLAGNGASSREVVASWDESERHAAERGLCLDYLYVPVYTTCLAVLSVMAAQAFGAKGMVTMANIAIAVAWGPWAIALFDVAENSALLRALQLYPDIPDGLARFVSWCARLKFVLIVLAVLCCLFSLLTTVG